MSRFLLLSFCLCVCLCAFFFFCACVYLCRFLVVFLFVFVSVFSFFVFVSVCFFLVFFFNLTKHHCASCSDAYKQEKESGTADWQDAVCGQAATVPLLFGCLVSILALFFHVQRDRATQRGRGRQRSRYKATKKERRDLTHTHTRTHTRTHAATMAMATKPRRNPTKPKLLLQFPSLLQTPAHLLQPA